MHYLPNQRITRSNCLNIIILLYNLLYYNMITYKMIYQNIYILAIYTVNKVGDKASLCKAAFNPCNNQEFYTFMTTLG